MKPSRAQLLVLSACILVCGCRERVERSQGDSAGKLKQEKSDHVAGRLLSVCESLDQKLDALVMEEYSDTPRPDLESRREEIVRQGMNQLEQLRQEAGEQEGAWVSIAMAVLAWQGTPSQMQSSLAEMESITTNVQYASSWEGMLGALAACGLVTSDMEAPFRKRILRAYENLLPATRRDEPAVPRDHPAFRAIARICPSDLSGPLRATCELWCGDMAGHIALCANDAGDTLRFDTWDAIARAHYAAAQKHSEGTPLASRVAGHLTGLDLLKPSRPAEPHPRP